jgi:2-iminobutanoate/2-iminopropanoate deaminase
MTYNQTMIEFIDQPEIGSSRPFSRATRAAGLIFVSGHAAPHDPAQGIGRGTTVTEEVCNALALIERILIDSGSKLELIVQVTMLLTDPNDYEECNQEYIKHFPLGLPARHTARFGVPTQARVAFSCIAIAGT